MFTEFSNYYCQNSLYYWQWPKEIMNVYPNFNDIFHRNKKQFYDEYGIIKDFYPHNTFLSKIHIINIIISHFNYVLTPFPTKPACYWPKKVT